jgi:amino acid adenylation domain-containing protein
VAEQDSRRTALIDVSGAATTYEDLATAVDSVAAAVERAGVPRDGSVAVVLPNGITMATTFLGVASTSVCAPLNPAYTESEVQQLFDDLRPAALVTDGCSEAAIAVADERGVAILRPPFHNGRPGGEASPDDVALVLHTSGTTARPKQVPLSHENLCASAANVASTLRLQPDDRCLNVMPLFHIHGLVAALLASVHVGAAVICAPGFDAASFGDWLLDVGATWYTAVPTIHQAVLAEARRDGSRIRDARLRLVRSSSAPLPPTVLRELESTFGVPVIEAYGMTEASHEMASNPLPPGLRKPGTVGVATGSEIAVMSVDGQMVAPGVVGEVVIRGPAVTTGYVDNDTANAAAFTNGWFHTGDQGSLDDDGYLTLTGRLKEQINRGGEKISPREIDEVLLQHPNVAQAVAFAVPHPTLGEDVAVAVVPAGDAFDSDDLRQFASTRLSQHKVPQRIVVLEQLPVGPSGKLQRIGLADLLGLTHDARDSRPTVASVLSPLEAAVAAVWREVLHTDRVDADVRFAELGGDSLTAVALVAQIADVFDAELPVTAPLVEAPTVAAMAAWISAARSRPQVHRVDDDEPETVDGELTFAQEAMWLFEQLHPDSGMHVPVALRLLGPLNPSALERSLTALVRRHEGLRTKFVPTMEGVPRSVVDDPFPVELRVEDLTDVRPDQRVSAAQELIEQEAATGFDLAVAPLFRARLLRFADDDHVLGLVIHHLVADGWARGIIRNELSTLYTAECSGRAAALDPLAARVSDLAARERHRFASGGFDDDIAFWRSTLSPLPPPVVLPADRRRPLSDLQSDIVVVDVPSQQRERLVAFAREHDATLFMVLLAGFAATIHRHTGLRDIVVGVPSAGRTDSRSQGLIGSFVNELPVRIQVDPDRPFVELLQRVRAACLDAYNHQSVPFELLVRELRPERSVDHRPLIQVSLQLRNLPTVVSDLGDLRIEDIDVHRGAMNDDLSIDVIERDGMLRFGVSYPTERFDQPTVAYLAGHLVRLLAAGVDDSSSSVAALPMLTDTERAALDSFGRGAELPPISRTVLDLVADQVAVQPDRVAVEMADDRTAVLTYRELEGRANQLAHHLVAAGVERGDAVALCVPRSRELMVAIMAIMRAGGAFVPVDPTHPRERVAAVMADSGAVALVTTSAFQRMVPSPPPIVVVLDHDANDIRVHPHVPPERAVEGSDLAYVLFTSGSTGRPKGVEVEHSALRLYLESAQLEFPLSPSDSILATTSCTFDAFIDELLSPLIAGARIVLADDRLRLEPGRLAGLLNGGVANTLAGTPTLIASILDAGWRPGPVRAVLGGEVLTASLTGQLLDTCAGVWNTYGPTETTDAVTWCRLHRADVEAGVIPIGHTMPGRMLRIVDDADSLAGVGIEGELLIGGAGLARGYRGRPDLTNAAFVDLDTGDGPERMYRSGDRCRWRHDGSIDYLGRTDGQVKVHGVRIELGDIEVALARHDAVTAAVADVRGDRLVAWVTGPAPMPAADELQQFASGWLPRSMVPAAIMTIDRLPVTTAGKVDRESLPDPPTQLAETGVAPRGPFEVRMARLWKAIIDPDRDIFRESDFFALGGDSLMAVRLIVEIEERFKCSLGISLLFEHSTLAGLAAAVEQQRESGPPEPRPDPLVALRRGTGDVPPVFWVTGLGGAPIATRSLAAAVSSGPDIYGFEHPLHRSMPEPETLAELAADYVAAVERMGVTEFVLGGNSFGALVAHEMACQLAMAGRPPTALLLFDLRVPGVQQSRMGRRLWVLRSHAGRVLRLRGRRRPPATMIKIEPPSRFKAVAASNRRLRDQHTPRRYDGNTIAFVTTQYRSLYGRAGRVDRFLGQSSRVVRVSGRHGDATRSIPTLAAAIDEVVLAHRRAGNDQL